MLPYPDLNTIHFIRVPFPSLSLNIISLYTCSSTALLLVYINSMKVRVALTSQGKKRKLLEIYITGVLDPGVQDCGHLGKYVILESFMILVYYIYLRPLPLRKKNSDNTACR